MSSRNGNMHNIGAKDKYLPNGKDAALIARRELPEKVFVTQDSVITELRKSRKFQTIEHIFILALVYWTLSNFVSNYLKKKSISAIWPSLDLLEAAFSGYQIALIAWSKLMLLVLAFYLLVHLWVHCRPNNSPAVTLFDYIYITIYLCYQAFFVSIIWDLLFSKEKTLGPAMGAALSLEQCRLMAKMHSFAREVSKQMWGTCSISYTKKSDDGDAYYGEWKFPTFTHYLYFLFAPTLIYRDEYPRTSSIDWIQFFFHVVNYIGSFVSAYYIIDRYIIQRAAIYLTQPVNFGMMVDTVFSSFVPGTFLFIILFYLFFHAYLNAWAEVLRFGDRLFYKDWWNLTNTASFFHKWNSVVHDWLFTYVYKESYDLLKPRKSRVLPTFLTFAVSSIFHEYVIVAMLGFFLPLMTFALSGFGFVATAFLKSGDHGRISNCFAWSVLFLVWGSCFHLYFFEGVARRLCPTADYDNAFLTTIVPRFLSCLPIK